MPENGKIKRRAFNVGTCVGGLGIVIGAASLVLEFGFVYLPLPRFLLHTVTLLAVLLIWAGKIHHWLWAQRREFTWRKPVPDLTLLLITAAALVIADKLSGTPAEQSMTELSVRWLIFKLYLLILVILHLGRLSIFAAATGRAPTRILLISFALIIFTGAILLMLPSAHHAGRLSLTDAVFTATSATCVTGLIVRDTGGDFTLLGQSIIMVLIQIGGLGIMIFGALFALLLGSPLSLRESVAMRDIMHEQAPGRIGRIVVFICITTVVLEAVGAVGLYDLWHSELHSPQRWFKSVFHSVSAFCNAGFSLQEDSLGSYRTCWQVYGIFCPLIILGGLGFPVLNNLWMILRKRLFWWRKNKTNLKSPPGSSRLTLHSKIVLVTTLCLILLGWLLLFILEGIRPDESQLEYNGLTVLDSLFNSVTARTAGFNTIMIGKLSAAAKLVLILLMSVGGSPSSTAGGIKTVTFAVMVLAIYTTMRRQREVHIFNRTVPLMIIRRVATLIMLYGLLLWILTLLLTITEHSLGRDMLDLLFEAASALGTVGLSTGVTGHLTIAGKWVIIVAMFVGRLGPLSLLAALTFNARPVNYDYPREPLIVG